jgi:acyl-CoA reductase-like NAD-dependent aldehyde dehydrogenase
MATTEMTKQQLLIAGEWTDARSGETYDQTFPFTGEQVGTAAAAGRDDARAAVDAASEAFGEWSRSAPAMRREILNKAADLMMERQ